MSLASYKAEATRFYDTMTSISIEEKLLDTPGAGRRGSPVLSQNDRPFKLLM